MAQSIRITLFSLKIHCYLIPKLRTDEPTQKKQILANAIQRFRAGDTWSDSVTTEGYRENLHSKIIDKLIIEGKDFLTKEERKRVVIEIANEPDNPLKSDMTLIPTMVCKM